MWKIEGLKMLLGQFEEINRSLNEVTSRIHEYYGTCFAQWSKGRPLALTRDTSPKDQSRLFDEPS